MPTERPVFPGDRLTKRERVLAALRHEPTDRAPLLEQLSYNPAVIADWTGRPVDGFAYTEDDVCAAVAATLDLAMPAVPPRGKGRYTTPDGFVFQNDEWTVWHIARPFSDVEGAAAWLEGRTAELRALTPEAERQRNADHRVWRQGQIDRFGGTVLLEYSFTGFCSVFDGMGLELYSFFQLDYPEVLERYLEASLAVELRRAAALADPEALPVVLIPEDFSTKQGPLFSPAFLERFHYPYVTRLARAWHEAGVFVLYHSDGNYRPALPALMATGVDGFYCLEPNCGMDVVEFKNRWPDKVWAGGVDGVDLLERGTPEAVRAEVTRHIRATDAVATGGLFVASSSEINPPIPAANFRAMVEAVGACRRPASGH